MLLEMLLEEVNTLIRPKSDVAVVMFYKVLPIKNLGKDGIGKLWRIADPRRLTNVSK